MRTIRQPYPWNEGNSMKDQQISPADYFLVSYFLFFFLGGGASQEA